MLSSCLQWCRSLRFLNLRGQDSWSQDLFDEKRSKVRGSLLFPKLYCPSCLYTSFCWRKPIRPEGSPPPSSLLSSSRRALPPVQVQPGTLRSLGHPTPLIAADRSSQQNWIPSFFLRSYANKDRFWSVSHSTLNWAVLQYLCSNTFFSGGKLFYVSSSIRVVCVLLVLSPVDLGSAFHQLRWLRLLHLNASSPTQWF